MILIANNVYALDYINHGFKVIGGTGLNIANNLSANVLKQMGINIAFTNAANFSNMFDNVEAHISDVIHKTFIEVDENGTEAAAATVILMTKNSLPMPEEIKEFKANRPFTYFIRDEVSGEILFLGEYAFTK